MCASPTSVGKPQIDVVLVFADPLGTIEKLGLLLIHSDSVSSISPRPDLISHD